MARVLLTLFAVLTIFSIAISSCPDNEVWDECVSPCQQTCANPKPGICQAMCRPGCKCVPGYLRNKDGLCVPEKCC
ncbi:chymotrypsin inhibitor-like [Hylaeus anthracinus]|uniref:chymotrypsin inhibitor-like n=1 Tax=Hylaeus anthracinus TaxID=313031 RepID=UPI0023B91305|nr:chymotrypsin inhibitor-like [Hylaeus anthracinus]